MMTRPPTKKEWDQANEKWRDVLRSLPTDKRFSQAQARAILGAIAFVDSNFVDQGERTPGPDSFRINDKTGDAFLNWKRPRLTIKLVVSKDGKATWETRNSLVKMTPGPHGADLSFQKRHDTTEMVTQEPVFAACLMACFLPDGPESFGAEA